MSRHHLAYSRARCVRRLSRLGHATASGAPEHLESRVFLSTTIYVDSAANGANTGANWTDAYTSLAAALTTAEPGTELRIAGGVYRPTESTDRMISFELASGVGLYGGYAGNGGADPDVRDIVGHPTILSGDIGVLGDNQDNSAHVVRAAFVDASAVLDGCTITGGKSVEYTEQVGAGMANFGASPTVNSCIFIGNRSVSAAAMSNRYSSPVVTNCLFTENVADSSGGGMVNGESSAPTLSGCVFIQNHAGSSGGAIFSYTDAAPRIDDCQFIRNTSGMAGGAVCDFSNVTTRTTGCAFLGNSSTYDGGAMSDGDQDVQLVNCVFVGNRSRDGGALANAGDGAETLVNCVFVANAATGRGGAMYNVYVAASISNSILRANTATYGDQIFDGGVFVSGVSTSDVEGGFTGAGNIDANPAFVRDPSSGADLVWGTADDDYGDLRPQPASPCIDVANNASVPVAVQRDIRGYTRIIDFPGVHDPGAIVDMGAYERGMTATVVGTPQADTVTSSAQGFTLNGATMRDVDEVSFDGVGGWDVVALEGGGPDVHFPGTQHFESFTISAGANATLSAGSNAVLVTRALSIAPGALLDLADNDLILDYVEDSPLGAVQDFIRSGHANGSWAGFGITSQTARQNSAHNTTLGAMEAADYLALHPGETTFAGEPVDSTAVLVKYTWYGDANFDGSVNYDDFALTDAGFNSLFGGWSNGDFNEDGIVDFDDYVLIDFGFNSQSGVL